MTWRTSLMGAWIPLTIPLLVAASPEPPAEPLVAYVVSGSTAPSVLIDIVVPSQFRTADIDPSMVEIEAGEIESVSPVDPTSIVVGLVIDDGPTVGRNVVYLAQAASVELVRNVEDGTAIALSTPSGMLTAPTTDDGATIARIAGITAGAPDVVSLPRLVVDAAERLTDVPWPDRNLVVVLGRPITDGSPLTALADIAAEANIRVHVVADPGVDDGPMARIAQQTGGVAAGADAMLAEVDQVTAAIVHRVRVAATVDRPGPHELVLTLDGTRFATEVDVPAAPSAPAPSEPAPSAPAPSAPAPSDPPGDTATTAARPSTEATAAPATAVAAPTTGGRDEERTTPVLIAVALAVLVGTVAGWLWRRARRRRAGTGPDTPAPAAPATVGPEIDPIRKPHLRPSRIQPSRGRNPAVDPVSEPEPAGVAVEPRSDPDDTAAAAAAGRRRPPAERPRRATPRRRPATSESAPAEVESPREEEIGEADEWLVAGRLRLSRTTGEVFAGARRVPLTPTEFAVLELLMTRGGHGVTRDAISAAASSDENGEEPPDLDDILAELRRKTGIHGRGRGVRRERALVYFFSE